MKAMKAKITELTDKMDIDDFNDIQKTHKNHHRLLNALTLQNAGFEDTLSDTKSKVETTNEVVNTINKSVSALVENQKTIFKSNERKDKFMEDYMKEEKEGREKIIKDSKEYTDAKEKVLNSKINFRTLIAAAALSAVVGMFGVAGNYVIEDLKEDIALIREDGKTKLALSNQEK